MNIIDFVKPFEDWTTNEVADHFNKHRLVVKAMEAINDRIASALPTFEYRVGAKLIGWLVGELDSSFQFGIQGYSAEYTLPLKAFIDSDDFVNDRKEELTQRDFLIKQQVKESELRRAKHLRNVIAEIERRYAPS